MFGCQTTYSFCASVPVYIRVYVRTNEPCIHVLIRTMVISCKQLTVIVVVVVIRNVLYFLL